MGDIIDDKIKEELEKKKKNSKSRSLFRGAAKLALYTTMFLGVGVVGDKLDLERRLWQPIIYSNTIIDKDTPKDIFSYDLEIKKGKKGLELFLVNESNNKYLKIHKDGHTRRFPDEVTSWYKRTKNNIENFFRKLYYSTKYKLEEKK